MHFQTTATTILSGATISTTRCTNGCAHVPGLTRPPAISTSSGPASKESISSPHIQLVLADEEDACSDTCNKRHGCYHPLVEPVDEKAARKFTLSPCFTERGQGFVFNPEASVQRAVRGSSHCASVKSKASTPSKRRKVKAHDVSPPRDVYTVPLYRDNTPPPDLLCPPRLQPLPLLHRAYLYPLPQLHLSPAHLGNCPLPHLCRGLSLLPAMHLICSAATALPHPAPPPSRLGTLR
ncbi:hypothetical protein K438DRAFT_1124620 [Mycena galopus ATCC 62051]|nr:hypothetical protein K438DRAFT_1124620 [Mycena galopus ATCC 62051]